MLDPEL
jgi:hypothetical protein